MLSLCLPLFTTAQVIENPSPKNTGVTYDCAIENSGRAQGECTFQDLIAAAQKVINKIIPLTLGFSVVVIAYAGYLYMISGDNANKRKEANEMLRKVVIGIVFILAAWLIVSLILSALGVKSSITFS